MAKYNYMHGNEESYHVMQNKVLILIKREYCKQLNIVIHNHHDMKWYQELLGKVDKKTRNKFRLIALTEDVYYKYMTNETNTSIVKVCILEQERSTQKIVSTNRTRLCIVGMCREGKNFKSTLKFAEYIAQDIIEFVYCGWIPNKSIQDSGLVEAVKTGTISEVLGSSRRIEDMKMHQFIKESDAIIDLKIPKNRENILMSSGNIGLSIALNTPLIAHRNNYPSHNCIRYEDYEDLGHILGSSTLKETLHEQSIFEGVSKRGVSNGQNAYGGRSRI